VRIGDQQAEFESHSHWFTENSLEESLRPGECLVCSNLVQSERRGIHSFLWEGMMSPHVRSQFLRGGGFCPRHFWVAKRIEDDCWPAGGIGVAILCENLIEQAIAELPSETEFGRSEPIGLFQRKRNPSVPAPGFGCIFCRDALEQEQSLVETLQYLKNKSAWSGRLEASPLCEHHALLALHIWRNPDDKRLLRASLERRLTELRGDLNEFIRKHDWNHREEPMGREKDAVQRAIEIMTGLLRHFPFQRIGAEGGENHGTRER